MPPRRGVLLVNLGSPDSSSVRDVRRYLNQFLMDPRVIDSPWIIRRFVVSCFILPSRPKHVAAAYQHVWTDQGSPLIAISCRVARQVQEQIDLPVALGMSYGNPSIPAALRELLGSTGERIDEVFLIPLYPHYAMSTYESAVVAVRQGLARLAPRVHLNLKPPFYQDSDYIDALVTSAKPFLKTGYDHVLFSYHGLPLRHLRKSDPTRSHCLTSPECCEVSSEAHQTCYRHQVIRTTDSFVRLAGIPRSKYSIGFQSRLGRDPWLEPHTDQTIRRLAESGVRRLLVICPSFVADCLETLHEIGEEGREIFIRHGGGDFELIPCLNDHRQWIEVLASWCR